jgi:UDP-N-acetylglucosamine diphosphorylase / glucose-1-phosphate thymidylyltransferase / UDP-N-acetylgalactosamine diphosphorylase / glucosamine-1-phosphate N-acetyltransferase / galactosamine-1-phosphate N-acetyltransferase
VQVAVILAAGGGSRIWPFAETRPKPCLPAGLESLIARLVRQVAAAGVARVTVVAEREPDLRYALGAAPAEVLFTPPGRPGSAGSAFVGLQAASAGGAPESVVVLPGDLFASDFDVGSLCGAAQEAADVVALVDPLDRPGGIDLRPQDWIGARLDDDGTTVEAIVGHARHSVTHRITGALAGSPERLLGYLGSTPSYMTAVPVGGMPPEEPDLGQTLHQVLSSGSRVAALQARDPVVDVDKPWHLLEVNRLAARELCDDLDARAIASTATVDPTSDVRGHLHLGARSTIGAQAIVKGNAWIAEDVRVGDGAILEEGVVLGPGVTADNRCLIHRDSVIGPWCRVLFSAEAEGVLMEGTTLAHRCEITGVLGRQVDIGAGTISGALRFDDLPQRVRIGARWEDPAGAANCSFIGDFTRTGVGVVIAPGVRVGTHSAVGPGVVLREDVPSKTLLVLDESYEQRLVRRPWGPGRYGW